MAFKNYLATILWGIAGAACCAGALYSALIKGVYYANGATLGIAVCMYGFIASYIRAERRVYGTTADVWGIEEDPSNNEAEAGEAHRADQR